MNDLQWQWQWKLQCVGLKNLFYFLCFIPLRTIALGLRWKEWNSLLLWEYFWSKCWIVKHLSQKIGETNSSRQHLPVMQVEGAKNIRIAIKQKKFFTIILIEYLKWKYICVKNLFYLDITWNFLFLIAFIKYKCRKSTNFYRVICP